MDGFGDAYVVFDGKIARMDNSPIGEEEQWQRAHWKTVDAPSGVVDLSLEPWHPQTRASIDTYSATYATSSLGADPPQWKLVKFHNMKLRALFFVLLLMSLGGLTVLLSL